MYRMTDEEFEAAIEEALDAMPDQFLDALENVAIVWEDEPNAYHLGCDEWDGDDGWGASEGWEDDREVAPTEGSSWDEAVAGEGGEEGGYEPQPNDLLGLFDGLSLVERAEGGYDDDIPDVITVFKGPHERCFETREQIVEEIGKTIIHELGHYFGLDEDRLAAMGYE